MRKILKARRITILVAMMILSTLSFALAAEVDPLAAINRLTTLITTIVSSIGVIVILYGALQWGLAHRQQNSAEESAAVNTVIGGVIIAAAPWLVKYLLG